MIPLKLSITGFLSYRDMVEVDFTSFDLACISGANGAGKSSLLDAMTWVLFGYARKKDESVIHAHSSVDAAKVSLCFEYEENIYRVLRVRPRGKTSLLEFHILLNPTDYATLLDRKLNWKPLTERSIIATQDRIRQTLRLDYDTFINASFFLQGKADQFTQQGTSDRKRILSSILGLDIWDTYRERAADLRKRAVEVLNNVDYQLNEIERELAKEEALKANLIKFETDLKLLSESRESKENELLVVRQMVDLLTEKRLRGVTLQNQIKHSQENVAALQTRYAQRGEEQKKYQHILTHAAEIRAAYAAWEESRVVLEKWNQIATAHHEYESRRIPLLKRIEAEKARLQQEVRAFEQRQAEIDLDVAKIVQHHQQINTLEKEVQSLQAQLEQKAGFDLELDEAKNLQARVKVENPLLKVDMDEIKARIEQLIKDEDASCPICGKPLPKEERERLALTLTVEGKQLGDRYRANQEQSKIIEQKIKDIQSSLQNLERMDKSLHENSQQLVLYQKEVERINKLLEDWQIQKIPKLKQLLSLLQEETYSSEERTQLSVIDEELKILGYDRAAHDAVHRAEAEGQSTSDDYRALETAGAALEQLERELYDITADIAQREVELGNLQAEYKDFAASFAAEEAQAPDLERIETEALKLREKENLLTLALGGARQEVDVLVTQRKQQKSLEKEREQKAKIISSYEKLERAFGKNGIPALLIEQALPQIENKANDILSRLSDGSMFVRFITQKKYKNEHRFDIKETLDIQITDEMGTRDYEMYSGGEAFRVNFAIRLALSEVLAQRSGARLQTLIIDEGFGSQDAQGRLRLIEAIHLVREDFAKILVISHIEEIKEMFPARLEVEKTHRGSLVRLM